MSRRERNEKDITHGLTECDRVVTVVAEEEGPGTVLGVESNEDARSLEHGVDLDQALVVLSLLHADIVLANVADLERGRPVTGMSAKGER